jgi:hypothetical protein
MASIGEFSGFHAFEFDAASFPCKGNGCKTTAEFNANNYYYCNHCNLHKSAKSQAITLRADDLQRAITRKYRKLTSHLPLHPKTAEAHRAFSLKGGRIRKLRVMPTITWVGTSHHVQCIQYPDVFAATAATAADDEHPVRL